MSSKTPLHNANQGCRNAQYRKEVIFIRALVASANKNSTERRQYIQIHSRIVWMAPVIQQIQIENQKSKIFKRFSVFEFIIFSHTSFLIYDLLVHILGLSLVRFPD